MRNLARLTYAAQELAGVPKDPDKRKVPLRKIVERFQNEHGSWMERLECGHVQREKNDIYGPTNAVRRRCRKCAESTSKSDSTDSTTQRNPKSDTLDTCQTSSD